MVHQCPTKQPSVTKVIPRGLGRPPLISRTLKVVSQSVWGHTARPLPWVPTVLCQDPRPHRTPQPHKDSFVDHCPLPPPPAEPYEAYLCRVGRSTLPSTDSHLDSAWISAVDQSSSRPDTTTGAVFRLYSPLLRPTPRYDGPPEEGKDQCTSSVPPGARMPQPRHKYIDPLSPWVWPRWDAGLTVSVNFISASLPPRQRAAGSIMSPDSVVGRLSTMPTSTVTSPASGLPRHSSGTQAVAAASQAVRQSGSQPLVMPCYPLQLKLLDLEAP